MRALTDLFKQIDPGLRAKAEKNFRNWLAHPFTRETTLATQLADAIATHPILAIVAPSGSLFMSGSLATTYLFKNFPPGNPGSWVSIATRSAGNSDYVLELHPASFCKSVIRSPDSTFR